MSKSENIVDFINEYENYLVNSFYDIWNLVDIEEDNLEAYSVIGGLLSRQVTLALQLARSPNCWNGHVAGLFLRSMTDLCIAFGWILGDIEGRTKKYIMHGLGDAKLLSEFYESEIKNNPESPVVEEMKMLSSGYKEWINSQRREFFVEVNLGNWAQLDYRTMSQESGLESMYKFAYKPFSHVAHNMWPHVSSYNCQPCQTPLHQYHLIPQLFEIESDLDYLYRATKYVHRVYEALIKRFDLKINFSMPIEWWEIYFSNINNSDNT